jgi:hypothetical protein
MTRASDESLMVRMAQQLLREMEDYGALNDRERALFDEAKAMLEEKAMLGKCGNLPQGEIDRAEWREVVHFTWNEQVRHTVCVPSGLRSDRLGDVTCRQCQAEILRILHKWTGDYQGPG